MIFSDESKTTINTIIANLSKSKYDQIVGQYSAREVDDKKKVRIYPSLPIFTTVYGSGFEITPSEVFLFEAMRLLSPTII
jgi:hypothetical protein